MRNLTFPKIVKFISDHYSKLTRQQIAEQLEVPSWWIKKQITKLHKTGCLIYKQPPPETPLSEKDWTEEIKNYAFDLRCKYLKPNHCIVKQLKEKFGLNIQNGALQFWFNKFKCYSRSKQDWMNEYLPRELMEKLLNESYHIIDISKYVKKEFDVYISDDLILIHIQNLGLLSHKLKRLKDIKDKSHKFSKNWLAQKINSHAALIGLSKEMGFSKTIVMKRIKEEGLCLIKHRKIWSENLEELRNNLLEAPFLEIPEKDFHQMMLGWLIGDGHLDLNGRFVTNHSLYQLGYLYLKTRILKKFITNIVTVPRNEMDKYYGGKEQLGISCPGFKFYIKYLNADGSKNYDKIISELDHIGWACYFMDDGSFWNEESVMAINDKFSTIFENKYSFGKKVLPGLLEVKNIDPKYLIPLFSYKTKNRKNLGSYWKSKTPEFFNLHIENDLNLSFINNEILNQNSLLNKIVIYYHKKGFPHFSISDDYLKKEYNKIHKLKSEFFWKNDKSLKHITTGNYILKHFMPHMTEAKYKNISPLEIFNDKILFSNILKYSLKTNKSILPNFIYDNLIHFNGEITEFPCTVAKALIEKFTKTGDLIVDPCVGWGGSLIGSASLNRNYIGFEPWDRTYEGLNNIIKFFEIKNTSIINSNFDIKKAPESCSLIISSPPHIDTYRNIETWKKLIFRYAEKALIPGSHLILNISRNLKTSLPSTNLKEKEPLFWFTTPRKKDLNKAEIIYIWVK